MIWLELSTIFICGILNSMGGYHWLFCRRYIMPVVLAITFSIVIHIWWIGITVLPVISTLCLSYKDFGFLGNAVSRGLWLASQALVLAFGVCIAGHLAWFFYVPYVLLAFVLGFTLFNLTQIIGDIIFGILLSSIILFLR